ncbi:hypothetical protein WJX81_002387 [Elliptochloris bilobata]|uniref:protein acetyllysine N-acetyltransferase n=1 Tax=Elliptochloris bilobata TaxID=381761 RepID=A0AAW1RQG4_9CHLO
MSLGYAGKLSYREELGGQLGAPELFDTDAELQVKVEQLAELVHACNNIVVFTGAGISTSCGIPDFRGPQGVWTLQRAGKPLPKAKCSFAAAKPSLTHQALLALVRVGKVRYIVSQNVDGLHLRSGVPRAQLAELHGNCFVERCERCRREYARDWELETVSMKRTGRACVEPGCGGRLRDSALDWDDALPEDELQASEAAADAAGLALCLGTSLLVRPACNLPLRTVRKGGKLAIVNLQKTPKDRRAALVVRARADRVMAALMAALALRIPRYVRSDAVAVHVRRTALRGARQAATVMLSVCSVHGAKCPLPMLASIDVTLPGGEVITLNSTPFQLRRPMALEGGVFSCALRLRLTDAADEGRHVVDARIDADLAQDAHAEEHVTFVTQVVDYEAAAWLQL